MGLETKSNLTLVSLFVIFVLLGVLVVIPSCSSMGTRPTVEDSRRFSSSNHYDQEQRVFLNRDREAMQRMGKRDKFKNMSIFNFLFGNDNNEKPAKPLPVLGVDLNKFKAASDTLKVVWFGHSTFLLNFEAKTILVDPMLSEYASPVPFVIGRFQPPPLKASELPHIDTILISHDHYDHLDMKTIRSFKDKVDTKFIVPLGVGRHLEGWGIDRSRITELDWWESTSFDNLEFVATPAQHFSGRAFGDRNATLWASWVIKSDTKRVFFSGDSGYDKHFKDIGDKYGPFDIAFIENGQYNKVWEEVHLLPEQSVRAFYDLKAEIYFPVHWGAFKLSIHPWYEPIQKVYNSSVERKFPLIIPRIGEVVEVSKNYETTNWWQELLTK